MNADGRQGSHWQTPLAAPAPSLKPEATPSSWGDWSPDQGPVRVPPAPSPPPGSPSEALARPPCYFILTTGGLYFSVYPDSYQKQTTTALPMVSSTFCRWSNPLLQLPAGSARFHPRVNVSNSLGSSHLARQPLGDCFPPTLRFQILITSPWLGIKNSYVSIWNGISKRQICPL